ncbi:MAG: phosphatidylserine decarboxylase [Fibrobacteria bacterium]|nr:phosphatidylserine decarboxylase [Fibrobacteria bacterium]
MKLLPRVALSRLFGRLARIEWPVVSHLSIQLFHFIFPRIDLPEASRKRRGEYRSLQDFFTRSLEPGARPIADSLMVSPCDGAFGASGPIENHTVFQAKGVPYSLGEFLGDSTLASTFEGGAFCTIYLAPWNYHRVHHPVAGQLVRIRHIAGDLWPVNRSAVEGIPGLFARNERTWAEIETEQGRLIVVLVGAYNVGSIRMVDAPRLGKESFGDWVSPEPKSVQPGDELGVFEMGSTVVLILDESLRRASLGPSWPDSRKDVRMGASLSFPG